MINYVIGDNVFELNANDIVYVKSGVHGYFGVVREIEEDNHCIYDELYATRKIVIHRPCYGDYQKFVANSDYIMDKYMYIGITKIPKDLFGSMILYKENLCKVLDFDISKLDPLRIENTKTKYSEWIGADDFIHVNWRKDDVDNVRTAEIFEEFQNKAYNKMIRYVKIISMGYRSDFENLEKGDRIVLEKENLYLKGEQNRYSLAFVTYKHEDDICFRLTDQELHCSIKALKNGNCLKYGFLKVPSSIKAGNTLWYEGNPAIIIKTPVLMSDDYMFSIEAFETVNKHHEVPVNTENYHKCVWNNADNKLKEAKKTGKAFKGV